MNPSQAFTCAMAWDEWVTRCHDGGVRGTRRGRDALIPDTMPIIAFGHWLRRYLRPEKSRTCEYLLYCPSYPLPPVLTVPLPFWPVVSKGCLIALQLVRRLLLGG